jgi:hypothetical protein
MISCQCDIDTALQIDGVRNIQAVQPGAKRPAAQELADARAPRRQTTVSTLTDRSNTTGARGMWSESRAPSPHLTLPPLSASCLLYPFKSKTKFDSLSLPCLPFPPLILRICLWWRILKYLRRGMRTFPLQHKLVPLGGILASHCRATPHSAPPVCLLFSGHFPVFVLSKSWGCLLPPPPPSLCFVVVSGSLSLPRPSLSHFSRASTVAVTVLWCRFRCPSPYATLFFLSLSRALSLFLALSLSLFFPCLRSGSQGGAAVAMLRVHLVSLCAPTPAPLSRSLSPFPNSFLSLALPCLCFS